LAARVSQVLAVTLNGGVAAGAVANEIGAGLSLTSVMLSEGLTASADTRAKLNELVLTLNFGATPLPLSLTVCDPNIALLFNCSWPFWLPFAVGTDATSIVQDAPGCSVSGQSLDNTANPLLTVGGDKVTGVFDVLLIAVTVVALLGWPTTSAGNEIDLGRALRVAGTGVGDAVRVGVTVGVAVLVGVAVAVGVAVLVSVAVAVGEAVPVGVALTVGVAVLVGVALTVGVAVLVSVGVAVSVAVLVGDAVGVGLAVGNNPNAASRVCVPT
jgi:hypothetical protein